MCESGFFCRMCWCSLCFSFAADIFPAGSISGDAQVLWIVFVFNEFVSEEWEDVFPEAVCSFGCLSGVPAFPWQGDCGEKLIAPRTLKAEFSQTPLAVFQLRCFVSQTQNFMQIPNFQCISLAETSFSVFLKVTELLYLFIDILLDQEGWLLFLFLIFSLQFSFWDSVAARQAVEH